MTATIDSAPADNVIVYINIFFKSSETSLSTQRLVASVFGCGRFRCCNDRDVTEYLLAS